MTDVVKRPRGMSRQPESTATDSAGDATGNLPADASSGRAVPPGLRQSRITDPVMVEDAIREHLRAHGKRDPVALREALASRVEAGTFRTALARMLDRGELLLDAKMRVSINNWRR